MEKCALCGGKLKGHSELSEGKRLRGQKCQKCGETFFSGREMIKWEILTGRRKNARKIGVIGDSFAVRIPLQVVKENRIHKGDYALFERVKDGLLLRIVHPEANAGRNVRRS